MRDPVCISCIDGMHFACEPVFDSDTDTVYPCACALAGHDPAGPDPDE
jgi:hypothetical protein